MEKSAPEGCACRACCTPAEVCRASRGETSQVCAPPGESGSNTRDGICAGASARRQAVEHCLHGRGRACARHRPVPAEPPPKARRGVKSEVRRCPPIPCGGRAQNGTAAPCLAACASPWARDWITGPAARVDVGGTTASVAGIAVAVQLDFVPKWVQNYRAFTSVTSLKRGGGRGGGGARTCGFHVWRGRYTNIGGRGSFDGQFFPVQYNIKKMSRR